eukprot:TRINITY_DN25317_c0_g1_i1.p1 TRINITY_DN25317_c0_g1~~TRINITY_DN25317_c0_g1_i1.p1  ORF type:complete len:317 (+),score=28.05 TRINITY_DN25317_c0_g1_i1:82-1032(+)
MADPDADFRLARSLQAREYLSAGQTPPLERWGSSAHPHPPQGQAPADARSGQVQSHPMQEMMQILLQAGIHPNVHREVMAQHGQPHSHAPRNPASHSQPSHHPTQPSQSRGHSHSPRAPSSQGYGHVHSHGVRAVPLQASLPPSAGHSHGTRAAQQTPASSHSHVHSVRVALPMLHGSGSGRARMMQRDLAQLFTSLQSSGALLRHDGHGRVIVLRPQHRHGSRPGPTRGAEVERIEGNSGRFILDDKAKLTDENRKCAVCLMEFEDGEELRALPCLHLFHSDCVDKWLKENAACPTCRADLADMQRQTAKLLRGE